MKICKYCFAEIESDSAFCTECGFSGTLKKYKNMLEIGSELKNRYVIGGVFSQGGGFISYYAMDTKEKKNVRITEFLPSKLVYRSGTKLACKTQEDKEKFESAVLKLASVFENTKKAAAETIFDVSDCFRENATFYYVIPADKRRPLSARLGNGRKIAVDKIINTLEPLTACLSVMHKANLFHGNVNPYNILCDDSGKVVSLTGYSYPPRFNSSPFDAPEKKIGTTECGARSDVYSLGAVIYVAATGLLPPSSEERAAGKALRFPENFDADEKRKIEKAMSLNASERYKDTDEFVADLKAKEPLPIKKNKSDIPRKIVMILAVICFIVSAGILVNYYIIEPYKASKQNDELASLVETTAGAEVNPWDAIREKYPEVIFPQNMNPAFADIFAVNTDFAGWLSMPEMNINSAIVQAEDNDKYLRRDFYGNSTSYGAPFFDYRNSMVSLDRNTIIYGHNMRHDDKIFGTLEQYRDPETFKKAPIIKLSTLYKDYTFKIYAVFISNSKKSDDNGYVFNYIFNEATNERFGKYIEEINKRKLYTTGVDINENDKILTLSTCCYDFEDARLVIVGRLLRDGETENINTSLVTVNGNPKFPQAYYDAKRIENPYKNIPNTFD